MPRKSSKTVKSEEINDKKPIVKKPVVKKPVVKKPVDEKPESDEPLLSDVEETPTKKTRIIPSKDSVNESFDDLISCIEDEISKIRESQGKAKGVKFLRSIGKKLKILKSQSSRVMKQKNRSNRKNNNNSGFLKPVQLSKEMATFTGWDHKDLKSRVDVTKYIGKYIRDNDLQNPQDRRQIIADPKLSKLLEYDKKQDDKPLTYYRIQTYMKKHFSPAPAPAPAPVT